jgi:hypothetical protein
MDLKKQYERALVILFGLGALGGGGFLAWKALSFKKQFENETSGPRATKLDAISDSALTYASKIMSGATSWDAPSLGSHKKANLFSSTPFVVKKDETDTPFDMLSENAAKLRDPIENWWLVENDLDYTSSTIKEQDADSDGFSNLDEWIARTNPRSSLDKPTFISKIYFTGVKEEPLGIRLTSFDNGNCGFAFLTTDAAGEEQRKSEYLTVGARSKYQEGRFKLLNVKQETMKKFGTDTQVSVAQVQDLKTNQLIKVVQGETTQHPTLKAQILNAYDNSKLEAEKGQDVEVRRPTPMSLELLEVAKDHVVLQYIDPKTSKEIKVRKDLRNP